MRNLIAAINMALDGFCDNTAMISENQTAKNQFCVYVTPFATSHLLMSIGRPPWPTTAEGVVNIVLCIIW